MKKGAMSSFLKKLMGDKTVAYAATQPHIIKHWSVGDPVRGTNKKGVQGYINSIRVNLYDNSKYPGSKCKKLREERGHGSRRLKLKIQRANAELT